MTIKQQGGIFGRNPTFNDVELEGGLSLGDNKKATFGASGDLEIFHSGSTSYIKDVGTGDLQIFGGDDVFIRGSSTNNYMARFREENSVDLYFNNDLRFQTLNTGISVTGNVAVTNGNGIDFSATAGTGTSELFDDYEEGTWTPTLTTDGTNFSSITYDTQSGTYTKVGRLVTVSGFIRTDAITVGSASGNVLISGLPYTSTSASVGSISGTYNWGGDYPLSCVVYGSSTSMYLYYRASVNGSDSTIVPSDMGTGANNNDIYFTITYMAS